MDGVTLGVVREVGTDWVVGDVVLLGGEVGGVADAMFEVAGVPDCAGGVGGVRVAALDELHGPGGADVDGGGEQEVDVIGHDGEGVEEESALGAVVGEGGDEAFGVGADLEVAVLLVGVDGEGIGGEGLPLGGHAGSLGFGVGWGKPCLGNGCISGLLWEIRPRG
jgi:hypothetical protein